MVVSGELRGIRLLQETNWHIGHVARVLGDRLRATVDFLCECACNGCTRRVPLRPEEYDAIWRGGRPVVVSPGHLRGRHGRVVHEGERHVVVELRER